MWTADAATYANVFVEMLDWHMKLANETATNAPAYHHRFNVDGIYWLWCYEQKKTPAEFARLVARIKECLASESGQEREWYIVGIRIYTPCWHLQSASVQVKVSPTNRSLKGWWGRLRKRDSDWLPLLNR